MGKWNDLLYLSGNDIPLNSLNSTVLSLVYNFWYIKSFWEAVLISYIHDAGYPKYLVVILNS